MPKRIYYTGVGAKKSGYHTEKEFMKVMKKSKKACSTYTKSLKCKPCKKSQNNFRKVIKGVLSAKKKNKKYKMSQKLKTDLKKDLEDCRICKTTDVKECDLNDYIKFSGAQKKN